MPDLYIKSNPTSLITKWLYILQVKIMILQLMLTTSATIQKLNSGSKVVPSIKERSIELISESINLSYEIQLQKSMNKIPDIKTAIKKILSKSILAATLFTYVYHKTYLLY